MGDEFADAWVTVTLSALRANAQALKKHLASGAAPTPKLMAVVKADAYGHGAARAAVAFREAGADAFGVTTLNEALEILTAGIDSRETPVLVFAPLVGGEALRAAISHGLHVTVCDEGQVREAVDAAKACEMQAALHLKVDTGMGRLGLRPSQALKVAHILDKETHARWAGVYTHFARAGEKDLAPTRLQAQAFQAFCQTLQAKGVTVETRHCANSAAALRLPDTWMDMVRAGTILYGQYPSAFVPRLDGLVADTWRMQARVVWVRDLEPGSDVGYGAETRVRRKTRAAVVPVGFADGFGVSPNSLFRGMRGLQALLRQATGRQRAHVYLQGQAAPVLGRVAMQMIVVDVTDLPQPVRPGDIADIPARRLSACARLPKIYVED